MPRGEATRAAGGGPKLHMNQGECSVTTLPIVTSVTL